MATTRCVLNKGNMQVQGCLSCVTYSCHIYQSGWSHQSNVPKHGAWDWRPRELTISQMYPNMGPGTGDLGNYQSNVPKHGTRTGDLGNYQSNVPKHGTKTGDLGSYQSNVPKHGARGWRPRELSVQCTQACGQGLQPKWLSRDSNHNPLSSGNLSLLLLRSWLDLWSSPFWVTFLCMWPFFNPTNEVVTFCLCGWCMLGAFLLPAFTCLGHECEDLLRPYDGMHVSTD